MGEDSDAENPLGFGSVSAFWFELFGEVGMFVGIEDGGVAEYLQAGAIGGVDEEK